MLVQVRTTSLVNAMTCLDELARTTGGDLLVTLDHYIGRRVAGLCRVEAP